MAGLELTYGTVLSGVVTAARKHQKMTQKDLADALGIGVPTWSRIESGESSISIDQLRMATAALGTSSIKVLDLAEKAKTKLTDIGVVVCDSKPRSNTKAALAAAGVAGAVGATAAGVGATAAGVGSIAAGVGSIVATGLGPVGWIGLGAVAIIGAMNTNTKNSVIKVDVPQLVSSVVDISTLWEDTKKKTE